MWAGWRVPAMTADAAVPSSGTEPAGATGSGAGGSSIFEEILKSGLPDTQTHIIWRGERVFAILNRYPYSTGHVLVLPYRATPDLEDLEPAEVSELWAAVGDAVVAVRAAFASDGINIGANLGAGSGPSVADHVHIHVVPRWRSDTNFMPAIADVRVLPLTLPDCWERLRAAWPVITKHDP